MVLLERVGLRGSDAVHIAGRWLRTNWLRILVHIGALLPLAWMLWQAANGGFVVDIVRETTSLTGKTALILLVLSLACTPLTTLFGFKEALRVRRALGVYAALYAGVHFLIFVWLDYGLDLTLIGPAILDQRYVLVGAAAGLILLALTITSTQGWQRRLGKNWKRLHRLVYLAGILAVVHFLWLVKDIREPLRYAGLLALLLTLRLPPVRRFLSRARRRLTARWRRLVRTIAAT
jgi:sulfoxide reductase heme-binding subunit YedZ